MMSSTNPVSGTTPGQTSGRQAEAEQGAGS